MFPVTIVTPKTAPKGGVNRYFQAKLAYYWNSHIFKTTTPFPTKFCKAIKTTRYSSWVVQIRASQIQDGGPPPSWKNRNIAISQLRLDQSSRNLAPWRTLTLLTLLTLEKFKFWKSNILENRKIAIYQKPFDRSPLSLTHSTLPTVKNLNFENWISNMAACRNVYSGCIK